jgi:GntR family transcriptional regulator
VLDAASPLPLYHQLAEDLFAQIRSGAFAAGHKLPSEHAMAENYGVGRPTVRQATDTLVRRGLLERKRGSGTFVRNVPAQVDLFSLAGTLVSFERAALALDNRVLGKARQLEIDDADHPLHGRSALRVTRVSRVDAVPVLLEEIDFAAPYFPGLARVALQGRSLSEVVEQRYRMRAESADQSFRVTKLTPQRAHALAMTTGAAILQVDRTLHFAQAKAAVFARMFCRTDRLSFTQRIDIHGGQHA